MRMPANLPPDPGTAQPVRIEIGILLIKLRRLASYWIAIAFARRQRQAEPGAQSDPGSDDPREFGIYRYEVGGEPTNTSERRPNDAHPCPWDDPERLGSHPRSGYSRPARRNPSR